MKIIHRKLNDIFCVGVFAFPLSGSGVGRDLFNLIFFVIFVQCFL